MNIERLIAAAQKIELACQAQENHTRHLQELAYRARKENRSLTHEIIEQPRVFEIGDLIRELRQALKE